MAKEKSAGSGIIPHLTIRDGKAAAASDFYQAAFGAVELYRHLAEDGKRLMHASLEINGGPLMINDDFPEMNEGRATAQPAASVMHLQVEDAEAAWKQAMEAGAEVRFPLGDQFWGDRYGQIVDPFGFVWSIGMTIKNS